jgi:hypothetical protein
VNVQGTQLNSEVKTGFDYQAYVQGLEGTRGASKIKLYHQRGDLVNSDVSATVRPANNHYNKATNTNGPGSITTKRIGLNYDTGGVTGLGNTGAGIFARTIKRLRVK